MPLSYLSWDTVVPYFMIYLILLLPSCKGCKILLQNWYLTKEKFDSATECLKELHWLPIKYRILFRILCLSYQCVNDQAPNYLSIYFIKAQSGYSLRSKADYVVPRTRTKAFGDRAFSVSGPREWINLPAGLQLCSSFTIFRKKLKTFLFRKAFH